MPLLNSQQKSQGGTFTQVGDEPLSKQVVGVRLPESIHALVQTLPNRTEWLRRVITEAAQRELMEQGKKEQEVKNNHNQSSKINQANAREV